MPFWSADYAIFLFYKQHTAIYGQERVMLHSFGLERGYPFTNQGQVR